MVDKVFLTEERRDILEGNDRDLTDQSLTVAKSRIRSRTRTALEELTEVAESNEIDNSEVFEPAQITALLTAILGDPEDIEPFYEAFEQGPDARQEHYEKYQTERAIINELRRLTMRYETRLERMQPPEDDPDLIE